MIVKINREQLTIDIDEGSDEVKANIIENTGKEFLVDLTMSFSDENYIYFLDKEELIQIMSKANVTTEYYDEDWGHFSDEFGPLIGRDLLQVSGIEREYFWELLDEVWGILREQYESEQSEGWRLPTVAELTAMSNKETNTKIGGFACRHYWSSTTNTLGNNSVWYVNFDGGCQDYYGKYCYSYVRCVRTGKQTNTLELAPSSKETMTWYEAVEYSKTLKVDLKDITVVKLNNLHYEEVKTEKQYKVRVELEVRSNELCEVMVTASDENEAKNKAIRKYEDNPNNFSFNIWEAEGREAVIDQSKIQDWIVEQL